MIRKAFAMPRGTLREDCSGFDYSSSFSVCGMAQELDALPTAVTRCNSMNTCAWECEGEKVLGRCRNCMPSKADRKLIAKLLKQGCPKEYRKQVFEYTI